MKCKIYFDKDLSEETQTTLIKLVVQTLLDFIESEEYLNVNVISVKLFDSTTDTFLGTCSIRVSEKKRYISSTTAVFRDHSNTRVCINSVSVKYLKNLINKRKGVNRNVSQ